MSPVLHEPGTVTTGVRCYSGLVLLEAPACMCAALVCVHWARVRRLKSSL